MAQIGTRCPAPARYLVRYNFHSHIEKDAEKTRFAISPPPHLDFFFFGYRNECDPDGTGSLDRDAFARGMAQIDEELRRAQVLSRANGAGGWGAASAASTLRPVTSRPILR
jgi:hypothetical protein